MLGRLAKAEKNINGRGFHAKSMTQAEILSLAVGLHALLRSDDLLITERPHVEVILKALGERLEHDTVDDDRAECECFFCSYGRSVE